MSDDPSFASDVLRSIVMMGLFVLAGQTVATVLLYWHARRLATTAMGIERAKTRQMGLLPMHVALISLSYLSLAVETALHTWHRVGTHLTAWAVFNVAAFVVGNVALWKVNGFERTRIAEHRKMMLYRIDPPAQTIVVDENTHQAKAEPTDKT